MYLQVDVEQEAAKKLQLQSTHLTISANAVMHLVPLPICIHTHTHTLVHLLGANSLLGHDKNQNKNNNNNNGKPPMGIFFVAFAFDLSDTQIALT